MGDMYDKMLEDELYGETHPLHKIRYSTKDGFGCSLCEDGEEDYLGVNTNE